MTSLWYSLVYRKLSPEHGKLPQSRKVLRIPVGGRHHWPETLSKAVAGRSIHVWHLLCSVYRCESSFKPSLACSLGPVLQVLLAIEGVFTFLEAPYKTHPSMKMNMQTLMRIASVLMQDCCAGHTQW